MSPPATDAAWAFCEAILPDVSRSFALIIPMCPAPIDRALCVAYLLCRIADTIEDDPSLTPDAQGRLYDSFLASVDSGDVNAFLAAWPAIPEASYGRLVRGAEHVLTAFRGLPEQVRPPIRKCVHDMIAGMRQSRPADMIGGVAFLCRDLAELDVYCHYVAGTVGIMSTALFEQRLAPAGFVATRGWREEGRRMGLALQMTNIIKDCIIDADRGVSFIPPQYVLLDGGYRLTPGGRREVIAHALSHLDAAMPYILAIPTCETGIRTFLLGSLLPAIATLEVAAPGTERHPKITRATMADILETIDRNVTDNATLDAWYRTRRAATVQSSR